MRLNRALAAAALVGLTATAGSAQTRPAGGVQLARLTLGSIQGVVSDERGGPVAGAMVSALGATTAMAITDVRGRFLIQALPPGEYVLRVHMTGFASSRHDAVRVGTAPSVVDRIELRRVDGTQPLSARPIMTAGVELPVGETTADGTDAHSHTETAWRLRHIKRSVLKQDGDVVSIADAASSEPIPETTSSLFGRAFDSAASMAASFFTDTPFSGEVNILTTSAFGPGSLFDGEFLPRGVAYASIGAPLTNGRWDVRASMSQSDVSAWIVAGTFSSRLLSSHDYTAGVSYSTQQFQNRRLTPLSLTDSTDANRGAGEIFAGDRWAIADALTLDYGARYARYDYLREHSLMSPHVGVTVTPFRNTRVTASVAQRMLAPGAEEFLAPTMAGPWLPPERTFAPLAGEDFRVERTRSFDVGVEHEFDGTYVVGVRRFRQSVDDQLATLFGLPVDGGPNSPGHYYVASAGAVDAQGWAVRLSSAPSQRIKGSVDYSITRAQWISRGDMAAIAVWAPEAIRARSEDVHDLTASVETEIPETATRVFILYKINDAVARGGDPTKPMLDARFDLQVNQALPFMPLRSARWEVLVGLRNLFRDPTAAGSVYDELLVIRPPKRVIGGVLVKF